MKKITDAADRPVYTRTRRNVGHLLDREGEESGDEEDEEGDPDGGGPGDGHRQPVPLPPHPDPDDHFGRTPPLYEEGEGHNPPLSLFLAKAQS